VLGDIVEKGDASCVVHLTESKRFSGKVSVCAEAIRKNDYPIFAANAIPLGREDKDWTTHLSPPDVQNPCFHYLLEGGTRKNKEACHRAVIQWAERFGLVGENDSLVKLAMDPEVTAKPEALIDALKKSQILTVVRRGPYGVQQINETLVAQRFGGRTPGNPLSKAGVPLIITRNTPSRDLWNGDIGVTVQGPTGMVALFPRGDDQAITCPVSLLPEHDLAYAITVHKSQGSEFENVLVVLPDDEKNPLLTPQLVYTGVTRTKTCVVILGTQGALQAALAEERSGNRDTGLVL